MDFLLVQESVFENASSVFFADAGAVEVLAGVLFCVVREVAVFAAVAVVGQKELAQIFGQVLSARLLKIRPFSLVWSSYFRG